LEYCRQLKKRGDEVIATCRKTSDDLDGLNIRVEQGIDISSGNSVLNLINKLKGKRIDVLIQNAGIHENNSILDLDPESIRRQFEINALSPLCFTRAILGNLIEGSKIILMTSRMGSIQDNTSGGSYGYRMSKVALCMAGKSLAIDLRKKGISVAILHPGLVSTEMTGFTSQGITTKESVEGLLDRIDQLSIIDTGSFWHAKGEKLPW
tara:strand:+ start:1970 stop:2593 length:624 start_codon:yes stop_codon:yes gene_type:complete